MLSKSYLGTVFNMLLVLLVTSTICTSTDGPSLFIVRVDSVPTTSQTDKRCPLVNPLIFLSCLLLLYVIPLSLPRDDPVEQSNHLTRPASPHHLDNHLDSSL